MGRVIIEVSIPAAFDLAEKVQQLETFRAGQRLQMRVPSGFKFIEQLFGSQTL